MLSVELQDGRTVRGTASTIAGKLAAEGLPVSPGEVDNPVGARYLLSELAELGYITAWQ